MRGHKAGNINTSMSVSGKSLLKIQDQHPLVWLDYGWVTQIYPGLKLKLVGLFFDVEVFFSVCFEGFSIPSHNPPLPPPRQEQ